MSRCRTCGKELVPAKWTNGNVRKYCSLLCYRTRKTDDKSHLVLRPFLVLEPIFCCMCGVKFVRKRLSQVCCSATCGIARNKQNTRIVLRAKAAYRKKHKATATCEGCGTRFAPRTRLQTFCKAACKKSLKDKIAAARKEKQSCTHP